MFYSHAVNGRHKRLDDESIIGLYLECRYGDYTTLHSMHDVVFDRGVCGHYLSRA